MPNFPQAIGRENWEKHGERVSVLDFDALADGVILFDGAINNGSTTFTSASAVFTEEDIGKAIWIQGAGVPGSSYTQTQTQTTTTARDLLTTIVSINSPTSIVIAAASSATVSSAESRYGTDNSVFIQKAFDTALSGGLCVHFPKGQYLTTQSITLSSNLSISGEGYTYTSWQGNASSMVMCCANVPVMQSLGSTEATGLSNINIYGLTFRGTRRPGSKGIYSAHTLGAAIHHCAFSIFGDQALFLDTGGIFGIHVNDCSATDSCLVDDRTEYVGCFDLGPSDLFIARLESAGPGLFWGPSLYGSGKIAAIKVTGNNSWVSDCMGAGSQIGFHVGAANPVVQLTTTLVNCRADQNQGHGFVIEGNSWSCHFIGCRSHNNALGATDTYDGFYVTNGIHQFTGCQVTKTPVPIDHPTPGFNFRYRNCFRVDNTATGEFYEPCTFNLCFIGNAYIGDVTDVDHPATYSGEAYYSAPGTRSSVVIASRRAATQNDVTIEPQLNIKESQLLFEASDGAADTRVWAIGANTIPGNPNRFALVLLDDDREMVAYPMSFNRNLTTGAIDYIAFRDASFVLFDSSLVFVEIDPLLLLKQGVVFEQTTAVANERRWYLGPGAGTTPGTGEFRGNTQNDAATSSATWLSVLRTGIVIDSISFSGTTINLNGNVVLPDGKYIQFNNNTAKIISGSGSPEGVVTAVGASIFLDAPNGAVYLKVSGSGNTGWAKASTLDPSGFTANRFIFWDGSTFSSLKVNPTTANHFDASGLSSGSIIKSTGSVFAVASGSEILTAIGAGVDVTELGYVNGVTSSIQSQIDVINTTLSVGVTGNVAIPKLTPGGAAGYLFFENGLITSFANPT